MRCLTTRILNGAKRSDLATGLRRAGRRVALAIAVSRCRAKAPERMKSLYAFKRLDPRPLGSLRVQGRQSLGHVLGHVQTLDTGPAAS